MEGTIIMSNGKHTLNRELAHTDGGSVRFGAFLKELREGYPERIGRSRPGTALAYTKLSQMGFLKCLESHEVFISQGQYSEIENGVSLPRDPKQFLAAVAQCLELNEKDIDKMVNLLGFAFTETRFGHDVAMRAFPPQR